MSVSQESWLPQMREIVKQQDADGKSEQQLYKKLNSFLGGRRVEVDKLSTYPALAADSATVDLGVLERRALQESLNCLSHVSVSEKDLESLKKEAIDSLYREASKILEGNRVADQSGLVVGLEERASGRPGAVDFLEFLPNVFMHFVVLSAARKFEKKYDVSGGIARSLLS